MLQPRAGPKYADPWTDGQNWDVFFDITFMIYNGLLQFCLLLRVSLSLCLLLFISCWMQQHPDWDVLLMGFDVFIFPFDWQDGANYLPLLSPSISLSLCPSLCFFLSIYLCLGGQHSSGIETEMLCKWGDTHGWSLFIVSFDDTLPQQVMSSGSGGGWTGKTHTQT